MRCRFWKSRGGRARRVPWPGIPCEPWRSQGRGPGGRRANGLRWISAGSYQAKPRAQMLDGRRNRLQHRVVDSKAEANRVAWEAASQKYVRQYGDLLAQAASGSSLTGTERDLLREILRCSP